jgi:hypothetical protein
MYVAGSPSQNPVGKWQFAKPPWHYHPNSIPQNAGDWWKNRNQRYGSDDRQPLDRAMANAEALSRGLGEFREFPAVFGGWLPSGYGQRAWKSAESELNPES